MREAITLVVSAVPIFVSLTLQGAISIKRGVRLAIERVTSILLKAVSIKRDMTVLELLGWIEDNSGKSLEEYIKEKDERGFPK